MNSSGDCVWLDGILRADSDARTDSGDGAHGFFHSFERTPEIGGGLRSRDRGVKTVDRLRGFAADAVECPGHSAWFAKRLYEGRIVYVFSARSCLTSASRRLTNSSNGA